VIRRVCCAISARFPRVYPKEYSQNRYRQSSFPPTAESHDADVVLAANHFWVGIFRVGEDHLRPDDPKEAYVVLSMAREIIDVWWGGDPEIERDRAQRHPIDLEEYGRKHGVLRHYEGLVEQPLGATARKLFVA
jgi:hypothetical protein